MKVQTTRNSGRRQPGALALARADAVFRQLLDAEGGLELGSGPQFREYWNNAAGMTLAQRDAAVELLVEQRRARIGVGRHGSVVAGIISRSSVA